jgi:hypothetical protein
MQRTGRTTKSYALNNNPKDRSFNLYVDSIDSRCSNDTTPIVPRYLCYLAVAAGCSEVSELDDFTELVAALDFTKHHDLPLRAPRCSSATFLQILGRALDSIPPPTLRLNPIKLERLHFRTSAPEYGRNCLVAWFEKGFKERNRKVLIKMGIHGW